MAIVVVVGLVLAVVALSFSNCSLVLLCTHFNVSSPVEADLQAEAQAEIGPHAVGRSPALLKIHYEVEDDLAFLHPPIPNNIEGKADVNTRINLVMVPEPYSYVLALFGVFGMMAVGTLFRKRSKVYTTAGKRSRVNSGAAHSNRIRYL